MQQITCERCGRNHAGSYGEYWYGTTDPHLKILGHEQVFICNRCLQDTLLREEMWLSGLMGFSSVIIYAFCNFFLLHPEQLPALPLVELLEAAQTIGLFLLMSVLALFVLNLASYVFRIPIRIGWLPLTRQSHNHIRDLLAISVRPYLKGYARFTRSQRSRLK